jgi:cell division transport system ATP-binding protein
MNAEVVIDLQDVSIFQGDNLVLSNLNVHVRKGEFVYLIGKTGSGKSSLLRTLYADLPLKQGEVSIAGYQLSSIKTRDIPFFAAQTGHYFPGFSVTHGS